MKTTNYLLIIVFTLSNLFQNSQAQTFENTCWTATSTQYGITVKLHFYPGNIYAYENDNGIPLDTIGYYYESNDTITFIDYQGDCNGDTGIYTFQIQNNVLDFSTVSDPCADRVAQAANLLWSPCPAANVLENTCWWAADSASTATVELEFLPGNLYTYKSNQIPYDTIGNYSIFNDTITFEDFTGACSGDVGVYTFQVQNNTLDFDLVNDNCLGRVAQADGLLWTNCAVVGVDEKELNYSIVVYPNPSNGSFAIQVPDKAFTGSLEIYSINGQLVYQQKVDNANELELNLELVTGVYVMRLYSPNQNLTQRLIIQ